MTINSTLHRPQTTLILAMSADGKITDVKRSPAKFGSPTDKAHLEAQIAKADGTLAGGGTLRSGGSAMTVSNPELLKQREQQGKPLQPVQIICSRKATFDTHMKFFHQSIPRWLLTTEAGSQGWQGRTEFERILVSETSAGDIDWLGAFEQMAQLGIQHLAIMGGGQVVASLLAQDLIDEIWLTVCPLIFGGTTAPTPVDGAGFSYDLAPRLELLSAEVIEQEVFLHYRVQHTQ